MHQDRRRNRRAGDYKTTNTSPRESCLKLIIIYPVQDGSELLKKNCPEMQGKAVTYNSAILRHMKLISAHIFSLTLREPHTKVSAFAPPAYFEFFT